MWRVHERGRSIGILHQTGVQKGLPSRASGRLYLEVAESAAVREKGAVAIGDQVHHHHAFAALRPAAAVRCPFVGSARLPGVDVVVHVHGVDREGARAIEELGSLRHGAR